MTDFISLSEEISRAMTQQLENWLKEQIKKKEGREDLTLLQAGALGYRLVYLTKPNCTIFTGLTYILFKGLEEIATVTIKI